MGPKPKCCEQNRYTMKESLKNYELSAGYLETFTQVNSSNPTIF